LAGLAKDVTTAKMVNAYPSTEPQDAYKVVAEAALPNSPDSVKPYLNRKIVKRVVMTIPYNSKPYSQKTYIKEALQEAGWDGEYQDILDTQSAVKEAMERIFPGPMKVMEWIEQEVAKAIKRGDTELNWTTPSGFTVRQLLNKVQTQRVELQLLGRIQQQTVATGLTDKVDIKHHRNATAPNLIHSLDADLIRLAALKFDAPIGLIHDSVLCRATDMTSLSQIVRETYMHLFAEHEYLRTFAEAIGAENPPPIIGDFQPESVIESTYFFC
jgi:DNA-directed RNA polymerase